MRLETSRLLLPLLLLGAVAGSLQAAGAAPEPGNTLGDDDRLLKKITLRRPDTTLRSLLDEIGKATGTKLTPPKDLAEQKFTLFFRDRPAARVMAILAEYLDRKWARKGDGYELFADRGAQQREAEHVGALFKSIWDEFDARIALSKLPADEVERLYLERISKRSLDDLTDRQAEEWIQQTYRLESARRVEGSPGTGILLGSLTASQAARLKSTGALQLSSLDGSLAPEVSSALIRRETADRRAEQPGKPVVRYVLVMGNHRPIMPATELPPIPNVYIGGRVHFVHGGRVVSGGGGGGFIEPRPVLTPLPPRTPHAALNRVIDPPRPDWTSRFTGLPDGVKEFAAAVESPWMDAPPLSAALSDLHDRSGLDIVSDSFVRVRSPGIARYAKVRLGEYLDKICERLHYAWTVQHDTLQLRSGLYYLDRAREVPPSEIDRLRQELKAPAGSQLQTLAHASLRLTPEQVRGLADHWPWYLQDDEVWLPAPDNDASLWSGFAGVLAVLGSLDAASRAQALSGQVVPMPRSLVALTRLQAQLVADPFENGDVPSIAEMATASVTARTMEQQNVLYEVDGPDGRRGPLTDVRDAGWRPPLGMQGFSYRLLAPPLPIQRITVEIRRSGPDGPSDLTSGVFLLSSPVRRSVIPEMGR